MTDIKPQINADTESRIEALKKELTVFATIIHDGQTAEREKISELSKQSYGRLIDAHALATGVLIRALLRVNGKVIEMTPTKKERDALFASFVIGLNVCEEAIATGAYMQANALLRQELETLSQLIAVRAGNRKHRKTPNIGNLEESLRRLYDDLSAATHLSDHSLVQAATQMDMSTEVDIPESTSGTRYFPAFDNGLARGAFGLHIYLILAILEELNIDLHEHHAEDVFTKREKEALGLATLLMHTEGFVEYD